MLLCVDEAQQLNRGEEDPWNAEQEINRAKLVDDPELCAQDLTKCQPGVRDHVP